MYYFQNLTFKTFQTKLINLFNILSNTIANYKNYFQYAYQKDTYPKYDRNKSTLRRKSKNYK